MYNLFFRSSMWPMYLSRWLTHLDQVYGFWKSLLIMELLINHGSTLLTHQGMHFCNMPTLPDDLSHFGVIRKYWCMCVRACVRVCERERDRQGENGSLKTFNKNWKELVLSRRDKSSFSFDSKSRFPNHHPNIVEKIYIGPVRNISLNHCIFHIPQLAVC